MHRFTNGEYADMHFLLFFAMEILSLHWENMSFDIRIRGCLTDVYLKGCITVWEKQSLSWRMHLLAGDDAMCVTRRMCWISCKVRRIYFSNRRKSCEGFLSPLKISRPRPAWVYLQARQPQHDRGRLLKLTTRSFLAEYTAAVESVREDKRSKGRINRRMDSGNP